VQSVPMLSPSPRTGSSSLNGLYDVRVSPGIQRKGPQPHAWRTPSNPQLSSCFTAIPVSVCMRILEAGGLRKRPLGPVALTCKLLRSRILDEVLLLVAEAEAGFEVAQSQWLDILECASDRKISERIQNGIAGPIHSVYTWKEIASMQKPHVDVERVVLCARVLEGDLPAMKCSFLSPWSGSRSWLRRQPQRIKDLAQIWGLKEATHLLMTPFVQASAAARKLVGQAMQQQSLAPDKLERHSGVAALLSAVCRAALSAKDSGCHPPDLGVLRARLEHLQRAQLFALIRAPRDMQLRRTSGRHCQSLQSLPSAAEINRALVRDRGKTAKHSRSMEALPSPRQVHCTPARGPTTSSSAKPCSIEYPRLLSQASSVAKKVRNVECLVAKPVGRGSPAAEPCSMQTCIAATTCSGEYPEAELDSIRPPAANPHGVPACHAAKQRMPPYAAKTHRQSREFLVAQPVGTSASAAKTRSVECPVAKPDRHRSPSMRHSAEYPVAKRISISSSAAKTRSVECPVAKPDRNRSPVATQHSAECPVAKRISISSSAVKTRSVECPVAKPDPSGSPVAKQHSDPCGSPRVGIRSPGGILQTSHSLQSLKARLLS